MMPLYRPRGHLQDFGTSGQAIPLARTTRWHNPGLEDLSNVPNDEIQQQDKGWVTVAPGDSLKEIGLCNHGPRH